ncbi:MAG: hypothetical protein RJR34_13080 [Candidatus Methanoculleus thermohydrogenotrophicum]|nr:hypothetical protein [Candidatus Methanoculleus thermohydrogenotrophicum]
MTRGVLPTPESVAVRGTDPVYSSIADLRTMGEAICRVTNSTDQDLAVTVQTALGDDPTFAKPNESGDGFVGVANVGGISITGYVTPAAASATLAPGATTYVRVSGAWAYACIKAVATAPPTAKGHARRGVVRKAPED